MATTKNKTTLSEEQQKSLTSSINQFWHWLDKNLPGSVLRNYTSVVFSNPTRDDWIMWVKEHGTNTVHFNSYVTSRCSFEYFEMILIHECFHLFVQDLPNKHDAKLLKHGFGEVMMKLLDIEADFFTALYYKQVKNASLIEIFSLYAEGSNVFGDATVLPSKLERFIGAILSVSNVYFNNPRNSSINQTDLYLPSIVHLPVDEALHLIISRNSHFVVGKISATLQDLIDIKRAYTNTGQFTTKGYIDLLLRFSSKALGKPIPKTIQTQYSKLR